MATLLIRDRTSDATVTAGLVDLAARGCIAFHVEPGLSERVQAGIAYLAASPDKLADPENDLLDKIKAKASSHDGYMKPDKLYHLLDAFSGFKDELETSAVKKGWLAAKPSEVMLTWQLIGGLEIAGAIVAGIIWLVAQASGLFVVTLGLAFAGVVTIALSWFMPARTRQGAMLYAMLEAYRRSMKLTMASAQSIGEVVKARALPWVTTPDQAMAWAIALGLNDDVQAVLARSNHPSGDETDTEQAWRPTWWLYGSSHSSGHQAASSGVSAGTAGLFSATAIPDPGSIMAALGSITHASSPASSSSGSSSSFSSGGFGGGGSSGGGGAGGGF
jgi:uncharacterized membrane protein YgcG